MTTMMAEGRASSVAFRLGSVLMESGLAVFGHPFSPVAVGDQANPRHGGGDEDAGPERPGIADETYVGRPDVVAEEWGWKKGKFR